MNYILVAMTAQWAQKPYSDADFKEVEQNSLMRSNWFQEYTSRIINYPGHMAEVFRITNLRIKQKPLSTSAVKTHGLIKVKFGTEILNLLIWTSVWISNSIFEIQSSEIVLNNWNLSIFKALFQIIINLKVNKLKL